jgi:hypothetical protein
MSILFVFVLGMVRWYRIPGTLRAKGERYDTSPLPTSQCKCELCEVEGQDRLENKMSTQEQYDE